MAFKPMFRFGTPMKQYVHTGSSEILTPMGRNLHLGMNNQIIQFYKSVKDITGTPNYIWTTNFDLFGETLNPQHLHGKFVPKMKKYEDVVYKTINAGKNYYYRYIWGHNGIGKMEQIKLLVKYGDYKEKFDFDFFYNEKFRVSNILIFGMGFKQSGFADDLKTKFKRYEDPVLGAIIDEHILVRIAELQSKERLKHIDITYFNEKEMVYLEKVLKEMGISNYRLLKCQDFNFTIL